MALSWFRRRSTKSLRRPLGGQAPLRAHATPAGQAWSLRFEDTWRLALADLADELASARLTADPQSQTLHLAAMRDAIDRVAREQADPAVSHACALFDRLVGSAAAPLALRHEAAQLALDTLTFLALADAVERKARAAAALGRLERLTQQALAA